MSDLIHTITQMELALHLAREALFHSQPKAHPDYPEPADRHLRALNACINAIRLAEGG